MKQDWMKQMRNQMGDYQRKAPEGLLDDIKKEMRRRGFNPVPAKKPNARTVPLWAWRAAGIAALLAVILLIGTKLADTPDTSRVAWKQQNPQEAGRELAGSENGDNLSNDKIGEFVRQNRRIRQTKSANSSDEKPSSLFNKIAAVLRHGNENSKTLLLAKAGETKTEPENHETALPDETSKTLKETPTADHQEQEKEKARPKTHHPAQSSPQDNRKALSPQRQAYHTAGGRNAEIRLGIYYAGTGAGTSSASAPSFRGVQYDAPLRDISMMATNFREEKSHHHLPVKIGFQIHYGISQRWSVQTGVSYTYLSSDFYRYTPPREESMHRQMHFIGIPISASYSVYRAKRLNMYLTAGGEAQKMVSGKAEVKTPMQGKAVETTTEKVKMNRLQMSANVAAGIEYNLTNHLSLYAEPGASYYFKNGSDLETYYTDKPLKFNLNVGLRLNINE